MILFLFLIALIISSSDTKRHIKDRNEENEKKYISYQVHSFNDMREWKQLFRKNITWMKLDPNYLPTNKCALQERVEHNNPNGCFILNHDSPNITSGHFRPNYNSTKDLLHILSRPEEFSFFFQQKLSIALCFKFSYGDVCNKTNIHGEKFISLVTTLLENIDYYVRKNNLSIEIILDGVATPGSHYEGRRTCLNQLWRPYNSTYIIFDDPVYGMFENDKELGYDRFQIMNIPSFNIFAVQALDYGKFESSKIRNESKYYKEYPVLLWEPSHQSEIVLYASNFLEFAPVEVPIRFAINIDPIQFQVYSASSYDTEIPEKTKIKSELNAWNIFLDETYLISNNFKISSIDTEKKSSSNSFFVLIYSKFNDNKNFYFKIMEGENNFGEFKILKDGELNNLTFSYDNNNNNNANREIIFLEFNNENNYLNIGFSNGEVFEYELNPEKLEFKYITKFKIFPNNMNNGEDILYSIEKIEEKFNNNNNNFITTSSRIRNNCSLSINYLEITTTSKKEEIKNRIEVVEEFCLVKNKNKNNEYYQVSTGYSTFDSEIIIMYNLLEQNNNNIISEEELVEERIIKGSVLSINNNNKNKNKIIELIGTNDLLDIGNKPQISIIKNKNRNFDNNEKIYLFETHGNGYCYNNEFNNKRADLGVCDINKENKKIKSMDDILVYNYGSFKSFKETIINNEKKFDVCLDFSGDDNDDFFVHGMFDQGSYSSNTIYQCPENIHNSICFLEVHRGISDLIHGNSTLCGDALVHDGIVIDSWILQN